MTTYSILIVEDHKVYASALLRLLGANPDLNIVAVLETAEMALDCLNGTPVDLVLADISLPNMSGIDLIGLLHEKYPELPSAILSGHLAADYVHRAMEAGARGYLVKDNPSSILEGIQKILNGETYISADVDPV
jgi:DNA-binding NarL/FixJ family response regulator